jgi:hypothetical protein
MGGARPRYVVRPAEDGAPSGGQQLNRASGCRGRHPASAVIREGGNGDTEEGLARMLSVTHPLAPRAREDGRGEVATMQISSCRPPRMRVRETYERDGG